MKRVLMTAAAAGFLSAFVLGCGDKATTERTKATGATTSETTGKGSMSSAAAEKTSETTKR